MATRRRNPKNKTKKNKRIRKLRGGDRVDPGQTHIGCGGTWVTNGEYACICTKCGKRGDCF